MWYFKKEQPKQSVYLSNGAPLKFEPIDQVWGIYPPEGKGISEWMRDELRAAIARRVGAITEISAKEYTSLIDLKKKQPSQKVWREEIGKGQMMPTDGSHNSQPRDPVFRVEGVAEALRNPPPETKSLPTVPKASRREP